MGSGFNFFTNAIDVSPGTTGSYQDVDVSSYIPAGSSGVILFVQNLGAAWYDVRLRKNGSSDDRRVRLHNYDQFGNAFVAVDSNRVFEAYIESTDIYLWLIGYTDDAVVYRDPPDDISISTTGSWEDVDLSSYIPAEAVGVIVQHASPNGSGGARLCGARCKGSTDEFTYGEIYTYNYAARWYVIKNDSNRKIQLKISAEQVDTFLIAYLKSPIVMFTNAIAKNYTTIDSWTASDLTGDTDVDADGVILLLKNDGTETGPEADGNIRKNGSTDDRWTNVRIRGQASSEGRCVGRAIGMDSGQVIEYYIDNTDIDVYVVGYCKPEGAQTYTKTFAIDTLLKKLGITKSYATDVLLKKPDIVKEMAVDALFKKPTMKDYNVDMLLKKLGITVDYDIDMLLKQLGITKNYGVNSLFKAIITKTYGIDAKFGAAISYMKDYNVDMLLKALGITKDYSVDALLKKLGITKDYSIDALFVNIIAITYAVDVLFKQLGVTKQYLVDGLFRKEFTIQYAIDLLLQKSFTKDYGIDAYFGAVGVKIRQYAMDVLFKKFGITKSYGIDTRFGALATYTLQYSISAIFYRIRFVGKMIPSEREGVLEDKGMEGIMSDEGMKGVIRC